MLIGIIVKIFQKRQSQLTRNSWLYRYLRDGKSLVLLNWLKSLTWKYSQTPRIPGQCPP
jgi:hypothetical protein